MNDVYYIWYIVGGIALFFVIVGFIADKSGLARKTFSKDSKKENIEPQPQEQNVFVENNDVNAFDVPIQEEPMVMEDVQIPGEQQFNYETPDTVNVAESEPLYISDEPQTTTNEFVSIEQDIDNVDSIVTPESVSEESMIEQNITDTNTVWDNDENLQEVAVDSLDDVTTNDEISVEEDVNPGDDMGMDIASDNAEGEWGVDAISTDNELSDSMDVELPNLDDIDINTDDEVWKF